MTNEKQTKAEQLAALEQALNDASPDGWFLRNGPSSILRSAEAECASIMKRACERANNKVTRLARESSDLSTLERQILSRMSVIIGN